MMSLSIFHNPSDGEIVFLILAMIAGVVLLGAAIIWLDRKFTNNDK